MGEAHVNSLAREAAENRLWLPQHGQLFMRDPAREYEDVSPRSQPAQGSTGAIQVDNGGVYTRNSSGVITRWVVPSRYGVLSCSTTSPAGVWRNRLWPKAGRVM